MIEQTLYGWRRWDKPRVPPFSPYIILVDRIDGTSYVLGQTGDAGSLSFDLSAVLPDRKQMQTIYGPYDGPYLTHPDGRTVKLYVASGSLQGEFIPDNLATRRILTRDGYKRVVLEITIPVGWAEGDPFTYSEINITE